MKYATGGHLEDTAPDSIGWWTFTGMQHGLSTPNTLMSDMLQNFVAPN
jgi:hypothetical protein